MSRYSWSRVRKAVAKEVKTQVGTIRITPQHVERAIQYGAMVVTEHDVDKNGKLSGDEKKAVAKAIAEGVARYAKRHWLPKIIRWFGKTATKLLTNWGVLRAHRA